MKKCTKCQINKELDQFGKDRTNTTGYDSKCKLCKKEYYLANKEHASKRQSEYYQNNKEERINYGKQFYQNNKEYFQNYNLERKEEQQEYFRNRVKNNPEYYQNYINNNIERIRAYTNNRYKTDITYRLSRILRSTLYRLVTKTKINKSNSAIKLLGCKLDEFRLYLEQQFKPEMNWSNHGTVWEIDHIQQCATFDLSKPEEQAKCFHYTNTRPLFITTQIAESFGYNDQIGNQNRNKPKIK